ncbi:MAG: SDR family oxidoreductase [Caulobacterales bacterium]
MGRLDGKRCIITGGGSGMGRAAALLFANEGGIVSVFDVQSDAAESTVSQIKQAGGKAAAYVCDVTNEQSVQKSVDQAVNAMGGIDVCWSNAGTGDGGTVVTTPLEHWEKIIRINMTGMFLMSKYVVPHLVEAGGGSLILTSSAGVLGSTPGVVSNMAAKGGVLGLTRQIAADFAAKNVRVNAICPGPIMTYALTSAMEDRATAAGLPKDAYMDLMAKNHPRGRVGKPEEVANVALFLASDESSWVNAQFINVTGVN